MFVRLLLAVGLVLIAWSAMAYYQKQNAASKKKLNLQYVVIGASALIIILALTGRLHWITAVLAALTTMLVRLMPLATRFAPLIFNHLQRNKSPNNNSHKASSGNSSTVQSDSLKIVLDHDSESINGEVIAGPHAGQPLDKLSKAQLRELLDHYDNNDNDSLQLLMAYVQRQYPDESWQTQQQEQNLTPTATNRKEALEILGIEDNATKEEISSAHKKLMQRLHPDRGGSTYLAAKVNQAKDFLLK